MITRMTHTNIFVHDQEAALRFYRDILGMELRADFNQGGFRWLTVGPKGQPDFEIVLMAVAVSSGLSDDAARAIRELLQMGEMPIGVFQTDDAMRDYEAWSKQGVEFLEPPTEQFGSLSARVRDPSGNWFRLLQPLK
jgi:catechol 2,3-dioxygenase-like lactoylglutathione lyase family enzyme